MYESRKPDRKKNVSTPLSAASTMKNHGPRSADQVAPEIASGLSYPLMPCSPQQTKLLGRPATAHRSLMVASCALRRACICRCFRLLRVIGSEAEMVQGCAK